MPVRLRRGSLIVAGIACLALLGLLVRGESSHAASSKPNVIMFTTDDQTVRDLAAMPKTQALIGSQGANFLHAYVSMSLCCPSRITVQTGEYAHNHHVMGNTPPQGGYTVFNDKNDLPIWLQQAGYRTIHIGKMPNGFGTETNETYVPPGWGPFNGGSGPARASSTPSSSPPRPTPTSRSTRTAPSSNTRRRTTRRPSTATSPSTGSTSTSRTIPERPALHAGPVLRPARSGDARDEVPERLRHARLCRSTRASTRRTSRTSPAGSERSAGSGLG